MITVEGIALLALQASWILARWVIQYAYLSTYFEVLICTRCKNVRSIYVRIVADARFCRPL